MAALENPPINSSIPMDQLSDQMGKESTIIEVENQVQETNSMVVHDFYEIGKYFSDNSTNVMVSDSDGQPVIPVYICRPLHVVQRRIVQLPPSPPPPQVTSEQGALLNELQRIEEMEIEIIQAPKRTKTDHSRKTRLIPKMFVKPTAMQEKKLNSPTGSSSDAKKMKKEKKGATKKPPKDSPPTSSPNEIEEAKPSRAPHRTRSRSRSESPDKPQFLCDKCDKRFYLKRAMLRHMYSHK